MTNVQINHPAPDGKGTSVVINDIEMNRSISTFTVEGANGNRPKVTIELLLTERTRLCMADADLIISESSARLLEEHGWTRPAVSA